jgi:hypothetical protein
MIYMDQRSVDVNGNVSCSGSCFNIGLPLKDERVFAEIMEGFIDVCLA